MASSNAWVVEPILRYSINPRKPHRRTSRPQRETAQRDVVEPSPPGQTKHQAIASVAASPLTLTPTSRCVTTPAIKPGHDAPTLTTLRSTAIAAAKRLPPAWRSPCAIPASSRWASSRFPATECVIDCRRGSSRHGYYKPTVKENFIVVRACVRARFALRRSGFGAKGATTVEATVNTLNKNFTVVTGGSHEGFDRPVCARV